LKRKLILHIGAHRTATSTLQDYLFRNIVPLKKMGFFYPFRTRRHLTLMDNLFSGKKTTEQVAKTLNNLIEAHKRPLHTIILSDEDICTRRDLSVLAGFRKAFDVKIVYTLRRQDLWLESWYLQNIKWQWNDRLSHCSFVEFMAMQSDFHWINYNRYVRHLEKTFGRDNIILNIHEAQQMPDGPVGMFCDSIGLTPASDFHAPARINQSFSPMISEFMRYLPLDAAPQGYRGVLTSACAEIDRHLPYARQAASLLISHPDRVALMKGYQKGNTALAKRYFGRDQLFLDPLPGPDMALAEMVLPADSYELMEQFVSPLIRAVIRHRTTAQARKSQPAADPAPRRP